MCIIEAHRRLRESRWHDHAKSYLALVRDALHQDPHDQELRELMAEMEAAIAAQQYRSQ